MACDQCALETLRANGFVYVSDFNSCIADREVLLLQVGSTAEYPKPSRVVMRRSPLRF